MPSPSVSTSEYYKYLPSNLTKTQKIRQLIIWLASNKNNNAVQDIDPEVQRVHYITQQIKREFIRKLITGDIEASWLLRPNQSFAEQIQRNPINIANEEKLKRLEENIAM